MTTASIMLADIALNRVSRTPTRPLKRPNGTSPRAAKLPSAAAEAKRQPARPGRWRYFTLAVSGRRGVLRPSFAQS